MVLPQLLKISVQRGHFCFFLEKKITVTVNFLLLVFKCNSFMLQNQKSKCLVLSRYPRSEPLERLN